MSTAGFQQAVERLLANFEENGQDYLTYVHAGTTRGDEAMVRQKIVEPLLTALSYDLLNRDSFLDVERYKQEIVEPPHHPLMLTADQPQNEEKLIMGGYFHRAGAAQDRHRRPGALSRPFEEE